jgi:D-glycero-D-manno-heptose 1,7-bisphosphate phosphatase
VLNVEGNHVFRPTEFEWIAGAPAAVKWLNDHGYLAIVVTNQAGIGRGLYTEAEFLEFTRWINEQLGQVGAHIDATYYCPHHPSEAVGPYRVACECRKPAAGLLRRALAEWEVDATRSLMIGDSTSDLLAAEAVGIRAVLFPGGNLLAFVMEVVPQTNPGLSESLLSRDGGP